MSEFIVAKYGGSSMARPEVVAHIVEDNPEQRVIVVSAPGKDATHGIKMTDQLIAYHGSIDTDKAKGMRDDIVDRFDSLYNALGTKNRRLLRAETDAALTHAHTIRDESFTLSLGEMLSARAFSMLSGARLLAPGVLFDNSGTLLYSDTHNSIRNSFGVEAPGGAAHFIGKVVVPGFYGFDPRKRTRLLGRGGSDRTGALYAAALGVDYENWTDVDGIFSADPRKVSGAQVLVEVTREEVREGAHGGSGVLQGDTILDLNGSNTLVTVRNTNKPHLPGTRVVKDASMLRDRQDGVISVTGRDDVTLIAINDMGMALEPGYMSERLQELEKAGLAWELMMTAQDSVSLTLVEDGHEHEAQVGRVTDFLRGKLLSSSGSVSVEQTGVVYVVGEDLRQDPSFRTSTLIDILSIALENRFSALPVSNANSPSLAFLTQREHVETLVSNAHVMLIEANN